MIRILDDSHITPYQLWSMTIACSLHFKRESSFDAFKYNFKGPRCLPANFAKRSDKYYYEKFARIYKTRNSAINFILANIIDDKTWIGDMDPTCCDHWYAGIQRIDYETKMQSKGLHEKYNSFDELFEVGSSSMPNILREYICGNLTLEYLVVIETLVRYCSRINKTVADPLGAVQNITHKVSAYKPFLRSVINVKKQSEIVKSIFT